MPTPTESDKLREENQQDSFEYARTQQLKSDAETAAYTGSGTDEVEKYANDSTNASASSRDKDGGDKKSNSGDDEPSRLERATELLRSAGSFAARNKKKFIAGGGITGVLAGGVFGFFSLLPLKIESMVKNISGDHGAVVENAMERRAMRVFLRYAAQHSSVIQPNGAIVATGSPLGDLYKTWRTRGFEAQLERNTGIKIERSTVAGKTIRVSNSTNSVDIAGESDLSNTDLTNREARIFINDTVRSETKWFQVIKRAHLRRWMMNAYGVKRWKVFENKQGAEAEESFNSNMRTSSADSYKARATKAISCMFGTVSDCPGRSSESTTPSGGDGATDGQNNANTVVNSIDDVGEAATRDALEASMTKSVLAGLSKAVPVIGWIDLGARMDQLVWNNSTASIVKDIRKAQYAAVYADWLKISDQIKEGDEVSGDEVNVAMGRLEDSSKSSASQRIYNGDDQSGEKLADDMLFDTPKLDKSRDFYTTATINTCGIGNSCPVGFSFSNSRGPYNLLAVTYINSIGKVFDLVGSAVSSIIGAIPGVGNIVEHLNEFIGNYVMKGFMAVIGPVLSGNETGATLFNAIDLGGDVTMNDFGQNVLGGQKLDTASLMQLNQDIAFQNVEKAKQQGIAYQFTDTSNPTTLASQFLAKMPASGNEAVTKGTNTLIASISTPFQTLQSLFTGKLLTSLQPAYALAQNDPYGLDQYGFTDADLKRDIDENGLIQAAARGYKRDPNVGTGDSVNASYMLPQDCDEDPNNPTVPNMCKADLAVIQALKSMYTTEDDGGINGAGAAAATGTSAAPVATAPVNPGTDTGSGSGTPVTPSGNSAQLAQQLIDGKRVTFQAAALKDILATSRGQTVTNCGKTFVLSPNMLQVLLTASQRFTIDITVFSTGHGCSGGQHEQGRAFDVNSLNGHDAAPGSGRADDNMATDRAFANYVVTLLPQGGGLGQKDCFKTGINIPSGIRYFADACNHIHVDVGSQVD